MVPRKRFLDNSNDFKLEELCRSHRKLVPAVRDFPPGCGIDEVERKPPKIWSKINSNVGRMVDSPVEVNIFNSYRTQDIWRKRPYFVSRPAGKVKFLDPTCMKGGYDQKPKVTTTIGMQRKNLDNVDATGKLTSNGEDKFTNSKLDENSKLKSFVPDESLGKKAYFASRSIGGEDKLTNSKSDENYKLKSFEPNESGRNITYFVSRSTDSEDKLTKSRPDENSKLKSFEPDESGRNRAYFASRSTDGEDKLTKSKPDENRKLRRFEPDESGRNKAYFVSRSTDGEDKLTNCKPNENSELKSFEPDDSGRNKAYFSSRSTDGEDKLTNCKPEENSKLKSIEPIESGRDKAYLASSSTDSDDKLTNSKPNENSKIKSFEPNFASRSKGSEDKLMNFKPVVLVDDSKLRSFTVMELGRRKTYFTPRSTGKVKYWDPTYEDQKSDMTSDILSEKEQIRREKIKEAMSIFEEVQKQLSDENKSKPKGQKIVASRVPFEVAKIVKQKMKWKDPEKTLGPVYGIQIGDKFRYRSQVVMFGLHCQPYSGIDFVNIGGKNLAISIVDARRYSNESGSSDTLTYLGQGGLNVFGPKSPPEDQKLESGNLALKNSMNKKTPVRVIKKVQVYKEEVFVYDGLYIVEDYAKETSAEGKILFKFYLNRVPGQPSLQTMLKW